MKKLILILSIIACSMAANCQKVQRDGQGNYFAVKQVKSAKDSAKLTCNYYTHSDSKKYPVYLSVRGKLFAVIVSRNGNSYKKYLN